MIERVQGGRLKLEENYPLDFAWLRVTAIVFGAPPFRSAAVHISLNVLQT